MTMPWGRPRPVLTRLPGSPPCTRIPYVPAGCAPGKAIFTTVRLWEEKSAPWPDSRESPWLRSRMPGGSGARPSTGWKRSIWTRAAGEFMLIRRLIAGLTETPSLQTNKALRYGFATVTGRANFIRHGELFPDQPAAGTVIMAYQGDGRFYAMVDEIGEFHIKGAADRSHVLSKVIIEGYRFDEETGRVIWAIDKKTDRPGCLPPSHAEGQRRDRPGNVRLSAEHDLWPARTEELSTPDQDQSAGRTPGSRSPCDTGTAGSIRGLPFWPRYSWNPEPLIN